MKRIKHILFTMALLLGSLAATAQNEEPIDIATNADKMLYTNAKCTNTTYGDQFVGWHVLFDNDASTFFHSEYSNKNSEDGLDHYLRVDLGKGSKVNAFSFTYTVRGSIPNNGNYSPKTMIVEGSNTAYGTYTELVSLNNLPNTGAAVYKSPVIRNGTAYRYIRFRVTETYTNSKVQGHSYFFMAEFGMMRVRIEGTCGDNLSWKLTDDNELIIEGTGKMYDYSSKSAPWYEYRESIQTITMGEGVTSIGAYAFNNCSNLTSITIPEGVTSIGEYAFGYCSGLTSITIPEGVTSIEDEAFRGCSSLTSITIPENSKLTSIGDEAFRYCSSLTAITIPVSVTSIGYYAFFGCSSLTAITIPEGVTSIGSYAFYNTAWYNNQPDGVIYIGKVLYNYKGTMPENTTIEIKEGTVSISPSAFYNCSSLTSITIPESVTSIGDNAFEDCISLKTVINYSDLDIQKGISSNGWVGNYADRVINVDKLIDGYAFKTKDGVHSLTGYIGDDTELALPTDYQGEDYQIGSYAFYNCSSLTSITIPEGVTSIGNYAFDGCSSLTTITIPEGVMSIGHGAFYGCTSLTTITIPEGVTSIGYRAFYGCSSLTSITIPESVTSIGGYAFYGCSSLTSITIPESVTSIGSSAFSGCKSLTAITLPEGVTSIGDDAFYGCSSLTAITIPASVMSIGSEAFMNCKKLTSITIPEGVTSIGERAFANCSSLTSITIPESVTSIGGDAFRECSSLTSITIPENSQLTSIGNDAFYGCSSLTAITIPESVTSIGKSAFRGCTSLTSITISEGVTSIGDRTFWDCSSLTSITIPESVTSIGEDAFYRCTSLTSITIPEGVTSIGHCAFEYCKKLTSITIPGGVTSIGNGAFSSCSSLAAISCNAATPPTIYSSTFGNVNKSIPVYVPAGSEEAYKAAAYWGEFTNILPIEEPTPDYVTITINQYGSGTYSSEYALDFSEVQGLKAYVAMGYNYHTGVVTLLRVHTADAATGLLVKGTPGASYEVPVMEYTADRTLNMLVPTLERTEVDSHSSDGVYANYKYTVDPAQNPDEPLFYPFVDNSHLSAGKAYLQIPVAWLPDTGQKSIRYRFDEGETTDIEDEEIRNHKSEIIYDLYGRRVVSPKKGEIYIINNQKVVY